MNRKDSVLYSVLGLATLVSATLTYRFTILQGKVGNIDFGAFPKLCGEEAPNFLGLFDLSSAPGLLFYAYMPMAAVATLFALLLLQRKHRSLQGGLLVGTLAFFVLWILCILAQWLASPHTVLMYAWQIIAMLEIGVYLGAFWFAHAYVHQEDLPYWVKLLLSAVYLAVLGLTPTLLNIPSYNANICAGTTASWLWNALYFVVEPLLIVAVAGTGISAFRRERDASRRPHIALFTFSFTFFLIAFAVANYFGELSTDYEMNFWGPLGLLVSLLMAGYMVMQRLKFHWHTVTAQLLVWGLVTLIGTQFFYIDAESTTPFILNSAAFLGTIVFGLLMIRAATVEVRQKESEASMARQVGSMEHLSTVIMKDLLTRSKFLFNEFGANPLSTDEMRSKALQGFALADEGLTAINEVQNAYNLKNKKVSIELNPVDLRTIAYAVVEAKKPAAVKKGLAFEIKIQEGNFPLLGDARWLTEMANIFTDNAIRFTKTGMVIVGLERQGTNALFWVKDSGVGIADTDRAVLFTEGGHGRDSASVNPDSLGFGLYVAKQVAEAHQGRVWVDSLPGQGSTFHAELPLMA